MERRELSPNQIIPLDGTIFGNKAVLNIYFDICQKGLKDSLPPALVVGANLRYLPPIVNAAECKSEKARIKKSDYSKGMEYYRDKALIKNEVWFNKRLGEYSCLISQIVNLYEDKEARYFLIDGNHKATAETLTHNNISALELETTKDLRDVRGMVKKGELYSLNPDLESKYKTFDELMASVYDHIKGSKLVTFEDRVKELVKDQEIPKHMLDTYYGLKK